MFKLYFNQFFYSKTSAQRQQEWRLRNPEKAKEQAKINDRKYKLKLKISLSDEEKQIRRIKDAERKRLSRLKTKQAIAVSRKNKLFATHQIKGKLMKKARLALSGTSEQNKCILKTLLCEMSPVSTKETLKRLPEKTFNKVKEFYLNDEVSRASPNINDHVTVIQEGERIKISVKHLTYPIKEVHAMFLESNPEIKMSLSAFSKAKPKEVLSLTKIPHNVCCCQIHENMRCALKGLKKADSSFSEIKSDYGMHENFVCEQLSEECFSGSCTSCGSLKFKSFVETIENLQQEAQWSKWIKTNRNKNESEEEAHINLYCNIEKVLKKGTIIQLIDEICLMIPEFLDHQFIKMKQAKSAEDLIKTAMEQDSSVAVICCDFAEKFKCIQQNATQSAHYGQTPVSLFTVAIYHRKFTPMVIASDCEKHTKDSVIAYMDTIFSLLPETVEKVEIWSDNATSQFKNQYIMESLKTFEQLYPFSLRWNFYAPMHGKSVVDGIGGSVKRFVRSKILAQDLLIKSAEDFVNTAQDMKTNVLLLSSADIKQKNEEIGLASIVKRSKNIKEIKKMHSFEVQQVKVGKKIIEKIVAQKITL